MAINYYSIGTKIQKVRKSRHKTQEDMAEAMNVSVSYISQLERGVTKISLDTLQKISDYLDCSLLTFLEEVVTTKEEVNEQKRKLNDPVYKYMENLLHDDLNEFAYRDLMIKLFYNCSKSEQRMLCYLISSYLVYK